MRQEENNLTVGTSTRRRGFTLVELMMGMAVVALISASIAAMMFATSTGTARQDGARETMMSNELAAMRLDSSLRAAKMVLAQGANYLVLWMGDTKWLNSAPDLSELRRIERNAQTNQLWCYKAPANLAAGSDVQYDLATTNFATVTAALKGTASFPGTLWATGISAWTLDVPAGGVQGLTIVGYRLTATSGGVSQTAVGGAALRNH